MEGGSCFASRQLVCQQYQSLVALTRWLELYCRDSLKSSSFWGSPGDSHGVRAPERIAGFWMHLALAGPHGGTGTHKLEPDI